MDNGYRTLDVDLTYLKEFSNGDIDFEKEILESIIIDADEMLGMFKCSIENKDYEKIIFLAHSLKSLMNIVGSKKLYKYFYTIEQKKYSLINLDLNCLEFQYNSIEEKWINAKYKLLNLIKGEEVKIIT